jgi:hypothetical protein
MIFFQKFYYNYTNPNKKSPSDIYPKPKKLYKVYKLYNAKQKKLKNQRKKKPKFKAFKL